MIRARLSSARDDELVVGVTHDGQERDLVYRSGPGTWAQLPSTHDFVAVALAQYAAAVGQNLHIDGPVTSAQLENLDEYLQVWSVWRPRRFRRVEISATDEVDLPMVGDRGGGVMAFSGGVDAAFALAVHQRGLAGRLSRPIERGVLVVGWDLAHDDDAAIARASESVRHSLDAYDVATTVISTNWQQDFCPAWFMMFNSGLMSILHTLSGRHGTAVHATDVDFLQELARGPFGSNMVVNRLLGNTSFPVVSTGGTHSRLERVRHLIDHPVLIDNLRVCYQADAGGANCGRCEKCLRTQLELRAVGLHSPAAFPEPVAVDRLEALQVKRPGVFQHFEDILAALPYDDPWHEPVSAWLRRQRQALGRRERADLARLAHLEAELAEQRLLVTEMQRSTSWRITAPVRAVGGVARRVRSSAETSR